MKYALLLRADEGAWDGLDPEAQGRLGRRVGILDTSGRFSLSVEPAPQSPSSSLGRA
jgi:hypothetical protein